MEKRVAKKGMASAMPLGSFHLLDPGLLRLESSVDEDSAIIQEALHRGADFGQISKLMFLRARANRDSSSADQPNAMLARISETLRVDPLLEAQSKFQLIHSELEKYRQRLKTEFSRLPGIVRGAFASREQKESEEDWSARCFEAYLKMRSAYYVAGYDTPAETFLHKIQPATCLDKDVENGLHEAFKKRLDELGKRLDHIQPGLAKEVSAKLSGIGFQPRFIAPKQGQKAAHASLSNHAFGLAIDFNASWNPHIKDLDVIVTLKEATGYDFGALFAPMCAPEEALVEETYRKALEASAALQRWLRRYLPIYVGVSQQKKPLPPKSKKSRDPLEGLVGASIDPECKEPDLDTETNIIRLTIINKYHSIHEMQRWADRGVMSLPLALVTAMKGLGFGWGGEWEKSKDFMHFEMNYKSVAPPENRWRPLDELFPSNLGSHSLLSAAVMERRTKGGRL
jgi:hypothetical protein